jgi:hypothetical protein
MLMKSQGIAGLGKDLHWLYSVFHPSIIQNMPPSNFVVLSKNGAIGIGEFPEIPWHKRENEDLLSILGIKATYGE